MFSNNARLSRCHLDCGQHDLLRAVRTTQSSVPTGGKTLTNSIPRIKSWHSRLAVRKASSPCLFSIYGFEPWSIKSIHNVFFVRVVRANECTMKSRVSRRVLCIHFGTVIDEDLTKLLATPGRKGETGFTVVIRFLNIGSVR